eukprot:TRINITY_DN10828_c0_g1_i1.p1 TRINITY_DN10828_c0_g1~~TRINITY_DN10828_c0_g1_i1.p1  ORF type:complete len:959 (+),score=147.26 TRINITY_DN10828_c0_g1_i1:12-2888(+)
MVKVLNVAEKPSVAKELTRILSNGNSTKRDGISKYNPIYEFQYNLRGQQCQMLMTSVTGHLMEIEFDPKYKHWSSCEPVALFDVEIHKKVAQTNIQISQTLEREIRGCQWLVLWLDCDREGENIAFEVIEVCTKLNKHLQIYRARFSELIPASIHRTCQTLVAPNKRESDAVDARQEMDLRIGAAFTRFQTLRLQNKFDGLDENVISYGPCQFPTLGFIVDRYWAIESFSPEDFWSIHVTIEKKDPETGDQLSAQLNWKRNRLFDKHSCLILYEMCVEDPMATVVDIKAKEKKKFKPLPMTTLSLAKLSTQHLRISSEETMQIAEKLYQRGFLSYPRTETDSFPPGTDFKYLIQQQTNDPIWGNYASQLLNEESFRNPRSGKNSDNAHSPIHPTKYAEGLQGKEKSLYELVVRHFLASCSDDALGFETEVFFDIASETFTLKGLMVLELNFMLIYPYQKWNDRNIPKFEPREKVLPSKVLLHQGTTCPPQLISEPELLQKMDDTGIGTDATMAQHIQTVQERGYAQKQPQNLFAPTTLGVALIEGYELMGFELSKPLLRAQMEADLKHICDGVKTKEEVMRENIAKYKEIFIKACHDAEKLDQALMQHFTPKGTNFMNREPDYSKCGHCSRKMDLRQNESGARTLFCETCNESHQLPKTGQITPIDHICPLCNFQALLIHTEKGTTYNLCPWCYKHPPNLQPPAIESVPRATFPCFDCSFRNCPLATKEQVVRKCPMCRADMILKKKKDNSGYYVGCKGYPNCKNSVWLPAGLKECSVTQIVCSICRPQPVFHLSFSFIYGYIPTLPSDYTACIGGCNSMINELLAQYNSFNHSKQPVVQSQYHQPQFSQRIDASFANLVDGLANNNYTDFMNSSTYNNHQNNQPNFSHQWNQNNNTSRFANSDKRGQACFKCGEEGHYANDCPNSSSTQKKKFKPKAKSSSGKTAKSKTSKPRTKKG